MKKGQIVKVEINGKTYEGCVVDFLSKEETKQLKMYGQLIKVYIYELDLLQEYTYGYEVTSKMDENYNQYILWIKRWLFENNNHLFILSFRHLHISSDTEIAVIGG